MGIQLFQKCILKPIILLNKNLVKEINNPIFVPYNTVNSHSLMTCIKAKKIYIDPFYSSDYEESSNIDLYTITFNNPKIVEYQIKLIKKNIAGKYRHIICDNSNVEEHSNKIKEICIANDVTYFHVDIDVPSGYSDSHGRALNWVYTNVIVKRENDFGFIDHDIFPIKRFNIEEYLKNRDLYGYLRYAGKIWFLWPTFSFFKYDYVIDACDTLTVKLELIRIFNQFI